MCVARPVISIHAPLTGSDRLSQLTSLIQSDFNPRSPYGERLVFFVQAADKRQISIHAPLTGSDVASEWIAWTRTKFQSTLPLRGATPHPRHGQVNSDDFNPRSPYGERLQLKWALALTCLFQSTLPLRGATKSPSRQQARRGFQSTLPLRGATEDTGFEPEEIGISIHAPLTGSDRRIPTSQMSP